MTTILESPPPLRPLIVIDVDGPLNAWVKNSNNDWSSPPGYRKYRFALDGGYMRVNLNPEHGPMLLKLAAETGGELVWGSMWEQRANVHIGPAIGLPELRWAPVAATRHLMDGSKAAGLLPWAQRRPVVWFEDEPKEQAAFDSLCESYGVTGTVILVPDHTGITAGHIAQARAWLDAL